MINYENRRANMILLFGNSGFLIIYLFSHYLIFFYIKCVNFEYLNSAHHLTDLTLTLLLQFIILIFKNPFYFYTKYYLSKNIHFALFISFVLFAFKPQSNKRLL